jgi:hypothetical protein
MAVVEVQDHGMAWDHNCCSSLTAGAEGKTFLKPGQKSLDFRSQNVVLKSAALISLGDQKWKLSFQSRFTESETLGTC